MSIEINNSLFEIALRLIGKRRGEIIETERSKICWLDSLLHRLGYCLVAALLGESALSLD